MSKVKTILAISSAAVLLVSALSCGGIMASRVLQTQVINKLHTDTVDVSLSSTLPKDTLLIDDSQTSQHVLISNRGLPCWIRVKACLSAGKTQSQATPKGLNAARWKKGSDGYSYYCIPLKEGGTVSLSIPVHDPRKVRNTACDLSSAVTVEAVQSENFTPNFSARNPWGTVTPQVCLHAREEAGK